MHSKFRLSSNCGLGFDGFFEMYRQRSVSLRLPKLRLPKLSLPKLRLPKLRLLKVAAQGSRSR